MTTTTESQFVAAATATLGADMRAVAVGAAAVAACPNGHGGYTVSPPGGHHGHLYTASLDDLRLLGAAIEADPEHRQSIIGGWVYSLEHRGLGRCIVSGCVEVRSPRSLICGHHWSQLPREVEWSWEGWDGPAATSDDGRELASKALVALLRGDRAAAVGLAREALTLDPAWDRLANALVDCEMPCA